MKSNFDVLRCAQSGSQAQQQFGVIADWTNSLNSNGDLTMALRSLMDLVRADAVKLIRSNNRDAAMRVVARCDRESGRIYCSSGSDVLVDALLGDQQFCAKQGSLWSLSEVSSSECDDFNGIAVARAERMSVQEAVVLTLRSDSGKADFLEIHYRHQPLRHNLELLVILSQTLAQTWTKRRLGIVAVHMNKTRPRVVGSERGPGDVPILDISNPMGLSRCEYRVAALLQEGMSVKMIANALSVCEATVRSHLSAVYSKIGATGQVDLLHLLNCDRLSDTRKSVRYSATEN